MNAGQLIMWLIIICVCGLLATIFLKQFKALMWFLLRSGCGLLAVFLTNFALAGFGLTVGVNLLSALVIGLLGVPGFALLYITAGIL